ncbi:MAG: NosD domain-containing protein [Methanomassiliicoccales archaeon]
MGKAMVERGRRVFFVIVVVLLSVFLTVPMLAPDSEGLTYKFSPIVVEGNGGFNAAGFTGSGTSEDPYLLREINLNASLELHGIRISNTTAHFRIVGCNVHEAYSPNHEPLDLSESGSGILLVNVTNAIIEDCLTEYNVRGVTVVGSSNVTINGSRFINNLRTGVHLLDCSDGTVKVTNSTFSVGDMDTGILIDGCQGVTVLGNTIDEGSNGIVLGDSRITSGDNVLNNTIRNAVGSGIIISFGTSENVTGNLISGCFQGVALGWTDNEVSRNVLSNNTRGILVGTDADRNLISGNDIVDGAFGVLISPSQGNEVLDNVIMRMAGSDSAVGIYLGIGEVKDTLVKGNDISECNVGIRAATLSGQEITGISISNNSISGSVKEGAYLIYTVNSELVNNSFVNGGDKGVYLGAGCHDLLVGNNEASYNDGFGLHVRGADDNVVVSNLFMSNVQEGAYLEEGSGNAIYGNALVFNKDSGRQYSLLRPQAFCGEEGNNWSLDTGNLWADWLSPDINDDGVVDLPYNLSGGCQDPYPLTSISGLDIPADITPPEVIVHTPQGLDTEQEGAISITFSEDMNASSVEVTVNLVQTNGTWNDRTFTPGMLLEFETDYSVKVNGRDLAGNNMTEFSWTFRTEGPNATVSGRVVDEDGNALEGVRVVLGSVDVFTGDDGRYSLEVAPGNYSFEFWKDEYTARPLSIQVLPGEDQDVGDVEMVYSMEGGISLASPFIGYVLLALAILAMVVSMAIYLRRRKR